MVLSAGDIVVTVAEEAADVRVNGRGDSPVMDAKVSVRNLFGFAEKFDLNMEFGQQKSSVFRLASRGRWLGSDAMLSADVARAISHVKHSSFVEKLLGGSCGMVIGQRTNIWAATTFRAWSHCVTSASSRRIRRRGRSRSSAD